jgi:hypothetical protein
MSCLSELRGYYFELVGQELLCLRHGDRGREMCAVGSHYQRKCEERVD